MIPQLTHSGRRVVGQGGQSEPLHGRPGRQDPLRQGHIVRDPGTLRGRAAAGDRDPRDRTGRPSAARCLSCAAQISQSAPAAWRRVSAEPRLTSCSKIRSGLTSRSSFPMEPNSGGTPVIQIPPHHSHERIRPECVARAQAPPAPRRLTRTALTDKHVATGRICQPGMRDIALDGASLG